MLKQMLITQWKWSRLELAVYTVLAFVVPAIAIKGIMISSGSTGDVVSIQALFSASAALGVLLVFVALLCGVTFAVRPWLIDQSRQHVFALSLPVGWPEFVRLRFVAGAILLIVPTMAVWLGSMLAAFSMPIPSTLHAYPASVAVRFYAAGLLLYATAFALQYLTGKRAAVVAAGAFALVAAAELVAQSLGSSLIARSWDVIVSWPGPFEVLTARWMLFDV